MLEQATAIPSTSTLEKPYASWKNALKSQQEMLGPESRTAGPIPHFGNLLEAQDKTVAQTEAGISPNQNINQSPDESFSFWDLVDIVNPLQHIPVLSTFYQRLTGDGIKPACQIAGGALYGGPIGAIGSAFNAFIKEDSGKDITENAFAMAGIDLPSRHTPQGKDLLRYNPPSSTVPSYSRETAAYERHKNFAARTTPQPSLNA